MSKSNKGTNAVETARANRETVNRAITCLLAGDRAGCESRVKSLGHEPPDSDDRLKDLLVTLAGEACRAVARALLGVGDG